VVWNDIHVQSVHRGGNLGKFVSLYIGSDNKEKQEEQGGKRRRGREAGADIQYVDIPK
jgi:hypothetical protein